MSLKKRSEKILNELELNAITLLNVGIIEPLKYSIHEVLDQNLYTSFTISGHVDSFISKAMMKILLKYLKPKYGNKLIIDVDENFALCTFSLDGVKRTALALPEYVNKTLRPGIFYTHLDKKTIMILYRQPLISEGDTSINGIRSRSIKTYRTIVLFCGANMHKWCKHIRRQIDNLCSKMIRQNSSGTNKVRVKTLSSNEDSQIADIPTRPMDFLVFPDKEMLINKIDRFINNEKIYREAAIPHRMGLLFEGPKGVGKTSFAYALAQRFDMKCVSVDLSCFDRINGTNAFSQEKTIYVIDEIDSQLPYNGDNDNSNIITTDQQKMRDRLIKLVTAMDNMDGGSIIIATTNYPEKLDPKLTRSGRFDVIEHFDNLDYSWACKMVKAHGLDPDIILKGFDFPTNPAALEQIIIQAILEKNDIHLRHEVDINALANE